MVCRIGRLRPPPSRAALLRRMSTGRAAGCEALETRAWHGKEDAQLVIPRSIIRTPLERLRELDVDCERPGGEIPMRAGAGKSGARSSE